MYIDGVSVCKIGIQTQQENESRTPSTFDGIAQALKTLHLKTFKIISF